MNVMLEMKHNLYIKLL